MRENIFLFKKAVRFLPLILLLINTNIYPKKFVHPTTCDCITPLLKKLGNTLDENRWYTGDIITTGTTISQPGLYVLTTDITQGIIIDSDNVWLDLNGYNIVDPTSTNTAITIQNNHTNIVIKNGSLNGTGTNSSASGILINEGCTLVAIKNVHVSNFDTGLYLSGISTNTIKSCYVKDCTFLENNKGVILNYTIKSVFETCTAYNCVNAGFELFNSKFNVFEKCKALETKNSAINESVTAFSSTSGTSNLFIECIANGTTKIGSNFGKNATGFLFQGTVSQIGETNSEIINCIINSTTCSGNGNAYGIHLDAILKDSPLATPYITFTNAATQNRVAWSPESKFIAIGGNNKLVRVFTLNNSSLTLSAEKQPNNTIINTVSWSSKGEFLAVGTNSGSGDQLFVYKFDPTQPFATNRLVFKDSKDIKLHIQSIKWASDKNYLAIGTSSSRDFDEIQIWGFNGNCLQFVGSCDPGNVSVREVSFSPDNKYLAVAYNRSSNNIHIFAFDPYATNVLELKAIQTSFSGQAVESIDWSPIATNSKYFLVVGSKTGNNTDVEVLTYNGNTSLLSTATTTHGAEINKVRWSPNGKYILACGKPFTGKEIELFSFNATNTIKLISKGLGELTSFDAQDCDWSPSGQYAIIVGPRPTSSHDTRIFDVAHVPKKCTIKYNEICHTCGGLRGIGVEGASGSNMIITNIGYENNCNFSYGIFNKFIYGLNGTPTNIENISVPPYED